MSPTYKTGAFVQQCFASHPLCLGVKKLTVPDRLVLTCSSCQFHHQVRFRRMTTQLSLAIGDPEHQRGPEQLPAEELTRCVCDHAASLRVGGMDVVEESLALRCASCRRVYLIDVAEFETHSR
jgi:hypothetical protein